jgi:8-oxo-dGTP pyrophosphatase MutT (NUDIX family)
MTHDPAAIPIRRAATVVVLRGEARPEILMLKRNARSVFVPDMWVFPGGAVDAADHDERIAARLDGLEQVIDIAEMTWNESAAHWAAVLRETYEEAGLVLGRHATGAPWNDGDLDANVAWRSRLNAGTAKLIDFLEATDAVLDASAVRYIARFITPMGPRRRYDARFFLAPVPSNQTASIDDDEAVGHQWISPADALDSVSAGDMVMMTPTVAVLRRLSQYATVADALAAADAPVGMQRMRLQPGPDDLRRIVFPGEDGYETADESSEFGTMRV